MSSLSCQGIECLPIIHGRLAFAIEARRRLLSRKYAAVAVELPATLADAVLEAVRLLPRISIVSYRDQPRFLSPHAPTYYVPVHPADGIIESLRIAERERVPIVFVDAEVDDFHSRPVSLPDPHTVHGLGLESYYDACAGAVAIHPRSNQDEIREAHMAAALREVAARVGDPVLFLCGMAHWQRVREHLEAGTGAVAPGGGVAEELEIHAPNGRSIPHLMGELPYIVQRYEEHRSGFELDDFDIVRAITELLLAARDDHKRHFPGSLERPDPSALRVLLDFARKMTVRKGYLVPDSYTLTVAANGVVGNDYALCVLRRAHSYAWLDPDGAERENEPDDPASDPGKSGSVTLTADCGDLGNGEVSLRSRTPGSAFGYGNLRLEQRPDLRRRKHLRTFWDPSRHCSWPPEDLVIENFRDYVGQRALSLARVAQARSEPFTTSYLDGIDIRATLRDVVERRIYVREERNIPGAVGALVVIFEEDDYGVRYPWRSTWMAEHHNESTLAFYATDFMENLIGPGIARAFYGGCLLVFPPVMAPDIWEDLRFERARTPSERLLLAAIYWARDHYIVHVGRRPPSPEVTTEANLRKKHILHLPLNTFGTRTLERLRRFHVLNGQGVRSWARGFIR